MNSDLLADSSVARVTPTDDISIIYGQDPRTPLLSSSTLQDVLFLGTGTSSSVPLIKCLCHPERRGQCQVCPDAQRSFTDAFGVTRNSLNRRRNTSLLLRSRRGTNILIDCGKTFYESALTWFPRYEVTHLTAVILTHPHADAMNGLDDLRQWTGSVLQRVTPLTVFCTPDTMSAISRCFPYLVDSQKATGGGDVAALQFIVFEPGEILLVGEDPIQVETFAVPHGQQSGGQPFMSLGFRLNQGSIVYISDTSQCLDEKPWLNKEWIEKGALQQAQYKNDWKEWRISSFIKMKTKEEERELELLVLDCLHPTGSHASHLCWPDVAKSLTRVKARSVLLVGMDHTMAQLACDRILSRIEEPFIRLAYDGLYIPFK